MNDKNTTMNVNDVNNPHDKLFSETWSNLDNARSFLHHYLPGHVLACVDLETLEKFSTIFYREMWYYTSFFSSC